MGLGLCMDAGCIGEEREAFGYENCMDGSFMMTLILIYLVYSLSSYPTPEEQYLESIIDNIGDERSGVHVSKHLSAMDAIPFF